MAMSNELSKHFNNFIIECEYSSRLRPETIRGYRQTFRQFSTIMPEVTNLTFLTPDMVCEFFKRLEVRKRKVGRSTIKMGIKTSTLRTYWSKLNTFFQWLVTKSLLQQNPLLAIKPPQATYTDNRALETSEIHKILSAITLHSTNTFMLRRDLAMVNLFIFCGLRRNELLSLQIRDVDIDNKLLTVRGETSKSKVTRRIPLHPTVIMHLQDYLRELKKQQKKTEHLIVANHTDSGMTSHGLKHWVQRLIKLSGVAFHVHRFRHTFACNLAKQNVNVVKIQKLMGHKDIKMTMTYLRSLTVEDFRDDVNKLGITYMV